MTQLVVKNALCYYDAQWREACPVGFQLFPEMVDNLDYDNNYLFEIHSTKTFKHVWHSFWPLVAIPFCAGLSRLLLGRQPPKNDLLKFTVEFLLIVVSCIFNLNNSYGGYLCALFHLLLLLLIYASSCWHKAKNREFTLGRRSNALTLVRGMNMSITCICILAVDFSFFPTEFRKTRRYGAGLMDLGIGFFVATMGSVSKRAKGPRDLIKVFKVVLPLLILGIARTVIIVAIDYHQDVHEYGQHLNAFFTLAFTKLLGSLISILATRDKLLLPLGIGKFILYLFNSIYN